MSLYPDERISIIASGYSVKAQNILVGEIAHHGRLIGVNDAGIHAPADIIVSMDRLWMESRYDDLKRLKKETWLRRSAFRKNLPEQGRWPGLFLFDCNHETDNFSKAEDELNGFNSGFCALNLAYHEDPREVFLFGFDHKPGLEPYWHPLPPYQDAGKRAKKVGKYVDWSQKYFCAARSFLARGIKVWNVNPESAIEAFPKITYQEFLQKCAN